MELEERGNPKASLSNDPFEWDWTDLEPVKFKRPSWLGGVSTEGVRLDIFDPKNDTIRHIPKGFRVFQHDTAAEAIKAGFESGENGVIVIEELMVVDKSDYKTLKNYAAIRRRAVDSKGPAIYATTQRPVDLPTSFRAIGDHYICGRIKEVSDLKHIQGVTGQEYVDQLPTLSPDPDTECEFLLYRF